jgi:adenine/guanine phosphoribosyltransferase-like PRPP-binding protein
MLLVGRGSDTRTLGAGDLMTVSYQGYAHDGTLRIGSEYLRTALHEVESTVDFAVERLGNAEATFDCLVGTGLSGALVVPALARRLGVPFLIVRDHEGTHSPYAAEGLLRRRWLFVDDKIVTGDTLKRVKATVAAISAASGYPTEFAGAYEYLYHSYDEEAGS